jgi:hypothetical protein
MCSNTMYIHISYTEKECVICAVRNIFLNVNKVNLIRVFYLPTDAQESCFTKYYNLH